MTVIPQVVSNVPTNPDLHRDESGINLASMDRAVDEIGDIEASSLKTCAEIYVSSQVLLLFFLCMHYNNASVHYSRTAGGLGCSYLKEQTFWIADLIAASIRPVQLLPMSYVPYLLQLP